MRTTMLLLATAAALLCNQMACAQHMMMPGMGSEIKPSQNMADSCYKDPSAEGCRSFRRDHMDVVADRDSLCAAMDFMVGCTLSHECTNGNATASSAYCKPWSLVGDLCLDMPGMKGCEAWNALCGKNVANVTVVDMCTDPAPVPNVLTTMDAKDAVMAICTAEPTLDGCATCDFTLPGYSICEDYLTTLSLLCQEVPENENCTGLREMCGGEGVAQAFPELCAFL